MNESIKDTLMSMIVLEIIFAIILILCRNSGGDMAFIIAIATMVLLGINFIAIVAFSFVSIVFKIDNIQKANKYALIAFTGIVVVISAVTMSNPLRWSNESIKVHLLKTTPIGMDMEDVVEVIESNGWKYHIRDYGNVYVNGRARRSLMGQPVGVKSIAVYLGEYRVIFARSVTVFYGFDKDSKLIDIGVLKEVDGP